jgi:hypothetical protein
MTRHEEYLRSLARYIPVNVEILDRAALILGNKWFYDQDMPAHVFPKRSKSITLSQALQMAEDTFPPSKVAKITPARPPYYEGQARQDTPLYVRGVTAALDRRDPGRSGNCDTWAGQPTIYLEDILALLADAKAYVLSGRHDGVLPERL